MTKPTPQQIERAYVEANLRVSLADALRDPLLARCLEITAEALAHLQGDQMPPPAAAPPRPLLPAPHSTLTNYPRRDFKRACAADRDEE